MTTFAAVNGERALRVSLHVPPIGVWWADIELERAPDLSGSATLALGQLQLSGTIDPNHNGVEAGVRSLRIVAGAGGWSSLVTARAYHNDAGVRAQTVATDVAALVGEQLGAFEPATERVGADYVRQSGPAARVLEDVIGAVSWWVDFDGRTQIGTRPEVRPETGTYQVLEVAPDERMLTIAVDDLRAVGIGSVLTVDVDTPQTVRELEIQCTPEHVRLRAWCGGEPHTRSRLARAFTAMVGRVTDAKLHGVYRYRVIRMNGDRVELQAVRRNIGLPDISPVSMWPGVAGTHADLTPGAELLVQFLEGDRTMPIVTHFVGKGGPGFEPNELVLAATSTLRLGGPSATEGVPLGTALKDWLDGHTHGYVDTNGPASTPQLTTAPVTSVLPSVTPNPSPSPSSKVLVE